MTRDLLRALLLLAVPSVAANAGAETLNDAFDAALRTDHRLGAEHQRTAAAQERLAAAQGLSLPSINAQGGYFHLDQPPAAILQVPPLGTLEMPLIQQDVRAYQLTASLPLFTGGRITGAVHAAAAAADAAAQSETATREDLKLNVAGAYVDVLRARRALSLAETSVGTLQAHAQDVDALYAKGLVARNDGLAAHVALANAQQDRLRAANAVDLAQSNYNRALGRPFDSAVAIDEIIPGGETAPLEQLTTEALATRSELRALQQQDHALRQQAVSARGEQWPQVALSGGRYYVEDRNLANDGFWAIGIGVSWSLFDGGIARRKARALDDEAAAAADTRQDAESLIRLQVRQCWLDIGETRQRIDVATAALDQAEENLRVARDRYDSGVGTNTEVLDAEALRRKSETNHIDAIYDNVLAQLRLRRAIGTL
ncbi:TolC family protein [Nevskia soli]|uniref:TolC family protein n=1 Tax=Nevskia soli TaxID=418856 RepID=UPI0004A766C2|nr:TolC family protein [Nevskia soli]